MPPAVTIVEPTTALRDWLRTQSLTVGQRIYAGGLPKGVALPAIHFQRIGGGTDEQVDQGLYQFDCKAAKASDAAEVASELASLLLSTGRVDLSDDVRMAGAQLAALVPIVDPDNESVFDMTLTAQITTLSRS